MMASAFRTKERVLLAGYRSFVLVTCFWAVFTCPNVSNAQALIPANQSLPEPTLVNEFLLNNQSNWTNPVLGNPPRPLQVIKCQSLTQPVYDFYQIEASRKACQIPPPIVNVLHPRHTPRVLSGLLAVATFLSVVLFGLILFWLAWAALLIGVCGSIGILAIVGCLVFCLLRCICCCCFPWEESSKDSQEAPEVEAPKPLQADKVIHSNRAVTSSVEVESLKSEIGWYESNGTAKQEHSYSWEPANEFNPFTLSYTSELQADTNSSTTADASQNNEVAASPSAAAVVTPELPNGRNDSGLHPDLQVPPVVCFKTKEGKKARKRDPVCQGLLIATYIVTLPVLTYVMVSAARMVPGGVKFFTTDTRVERLGPVPLPEPNQGLNKYLASKINGTSLPLQICKTNNLQFYALAPDACGRLADPYGGRSPDNELPARIRATCPKFLDMWPAKDLVYWSPLNLVWISAVWFLILDCSLSLCECEACKKERERKAEAVTQTEDASHVQGVEEAV